MTVVPIHPNAIRVPAVASRPTAWSTRPCHPAVPVVLSIVGVLAIALALRFYKLGAWAFWGDELVTFYDSQMLWTQPYWSPTGYINPHEQFIHAWPLGFWLLGLWHDAVGTSELLCRMPLALCSALAVTISVWFTYRLRGPWVAAALAALLTAWPWHLFHAQNHRPYSMSYLVAAIGFVLADAAFVRRKPIYIAWAGLVLTAASLIHNSVAILLGMLIGWQVLLTIVDRRHWKPVHLTALIPAVLGLVLVVGLVRHFSGQFMDGAWWRMSPAHSVASLVFNLGWPVTLVMTGAGVWMIAGKRREWMWPLACSVGLVAACYIGPMVMSFRPDYVFSASLPLHLVAAGGIGAVGRHLWRTSRWAGLGAVLAIPVLTLPSIASYYVDGDRPDFRAAVESIRADVRPDDVIWSSQCVNVRHYIPQPKAQPIPNDQVTATDALLAEGKRVWCLINYSTAGIPPDHLAWLEPRFRLVSEVGRLRYDYHQNRVGIFLAEPSAIPSRIDTGRTAGEIHVSNLTATLLLID